MSVLELLVSCFSCEFDALVGMQAAASCAAYGETAVAVAKAPRVFCGCKCGGVLGFAIWYLGWRRGALEDKWAVAFCAPCEGDSVASSKAVGLGFGGRCEVLRVCDWRRE